ncbi:amino acid ABC transporter permease [Desulfotalea psychrophila]|uniref:Putative glutamine transport system permease protein GlnP n=1 Tax=Desulfotalea psychrophila (strain LSv54 / DSM 12343) TaxID=177439 RepID=Q6AS58_DESPS|nr:amino acid ABC transporter permease [Desulfotalea psychrophila]CAG34817.1 related to glutamine transport system permease protein (GlnP) [Desulfotalea psychrophila LSv54]
MFAPKNIPHSKQGPGSLVFDCLFFLVLLVILGWLADRSIENLGYYWQWYQIPDFIGSFTGGSFKAGPLLKGLKITLQISGISLVCAFFIGLTTALLRLSSSRVGHGLAVFYLEISRNTPLLIQIFFIYFVFGPILGLERFSSAILALSLFEGAYTSEIFRTGILSIDRGQHEAAASFGLSNIQRYRFIILPQAIKKILPPLTNQAISLVKDSALVSTIAIYDLTMQAQMLVAETYLSFEIWFTVALIYLCINILLSIAVFLMDKKFNYS